MVLSGRLCSRGQLCHRLTWAEAWGGVFAWVCEQRDTCGGLSACRVLDERGLVVWSLSVAGM
jgi:hypothetical protein